MKIHTIIALLGLGTLAPLGAQSVPFPAGDFANPANWTPTGAATVAGGIGEIGPFVLVVSPDGSLTSTSGHTFLPNSLYEISIDIESASGLLDAALNLGVQVLDGAGNPVPNASLSQDQLINLLGIDPLALLSLTNLTTDLNLLGGGLTGDLFIVGTLRDLLGSLLDVDGDLLAGIDLASLQGLLASLVGMDNSVLAGVTDLLGDVLGNNVTDVLGNPLALTDLLGGGGLTILEDILSLDGGNLPDLEVLEGIQDLVEFVILPGQDGPVENLVALLTGLASNPTDLPIIADLLGSVLDGGPLGGQGDLLGGLTNILNLELIEGDLLGGLLTGDISSLLGILDLGSAGTFQTAKLLFTTGAAVPSGNLQVELSAGGVLGLSTVKFDNIAIRQFSLVGTPNPPGPDPTDASPFTTRPVINPKLPRVIRKTTSPRITIKGTAQAFGPGNSIQSVFAKVKGAGTSRKDRKYKKVKGQENWTARVRVPVGARTRVIFEARDSFGIRSKQQFVRVSRK